MGKKTWYLMLIMLLAFSSITVWIGSSRAEYPDRPITLIINSAPGGGNDLATRELAKSAEKTLGKPIVVLNKPGASGTIGTGLVAKAEPDGYTIGSTTFAALALAPNMFDVPYDPLTSFEFILGYVQYYYGYGVRKGSPFKTHQDVVKYAKANPGKLKYSVWALASPQNFGMTAIAKCKGLDWKAVVFKGGQNAMAAALGGHVDMFAQGADIALPHINGGRARLLGVFGDERWKWLPDVPTLKEMGCDISVTSYLAIGAPKGVPKPIMGKLRSAFRKSMSDPKLIQIIKNFNYKVAYHSPDGYKEIVKNGIKDYGAFIKDLGLHKSQKK